MRKNRTTLKTLWMLMFMASAAWAERTITSPDGQVKVTIQAENDAIVWSGSYKGKTLWKNGKLDHGTSAATIMSPASTSDHHEIWEPVWGKQAVITNGYRQLIFPMTAKKDITAELRLFDDAIAIRYCYTKPCKFEDKTHFPFCADYTLWAANRERANIGPIKLSEWEPQAHENSIQAPVTLRIATNCYAAILDAAIEKFQAGRLHRNTARSFYISSGSCSLEQGGHSSWRVILLGEQPGDLLTSSTLINLNKPSHIEDTEWIHPGIALWDWRGWGAKTTDGYQYALNMASWKRYIDFAAQYENIRYLLLDANWYGPEFDSASNPTCSRDHLLEQTPSGEIIRKPAPANWEQPIDIPQLIHYANERDVGIILYLNDRARDRHDLEQTLATYHNWGARGIKYGFMRYGKHKRVANTRHIMALCAKYQLTCNFHDGPVPPSGDMRSFPNCLGREFCHAQADAKRSFTPTTFCTTVFVNMLAGPLDMNNGLYAIKGAEQDRPRIFKPVHSTVVSETARCLIVFSGMPILPDIPEAYEPKADLFEFLVSLPMNWDETIILRGDIGKNITTARRSGDQWFVASACNEKGAVFDLDLGFLTQGITYSATIYSDNETAHYIDNPEAYEVKRTLLTSSDRLPIIMAPGGGHCLRLRPQPQRTSNKYRQKSKVDD